MDSKVLFVAVSLLLTFSDVMTANSPNGPNCPELYQRYSTSHSFCQPKNPSCNILNSGTSKKERNQIVDIHNSYRSIIATQKKESKGLPAAADMLYMEWDDELASVAQHHADRCIYEHDRDEERRVQNFGVGQNIAKMTLNAAKVQAPQADWKGAIGAFFKEIQYFSKGMVCGFRDDAPGAVGNFTQVIWAKTYRIGCGYTLYKEGNTFIRYYVCNYGPAGNIGGSCAYKEGKACSKCPLNTKCTGGQYPGLCKRTTNEPPHNPIKVENIFNCDLQENSPDCRFLSMEGPWFIYPTLSGKYLEIVLKGSENGSIHFAKSFAPNEDDEDANTMCVQIRYRKGPNFAKDGQMNEGKVTAYSGQHVHQFKIPNYYKGEARQQFTTYNLGMGWYTHTTIKIFFEVPKGATEQFFSIASIAGFSKECPMVEYY